MYEHVEPAFSIGTGVVVVIGAVGIAGVLLAAGFWFVMGKDDY